MDMNRVPPTKGFSAATVVLPVVTETSSLRRTVEIVISAAQQDVGQILLVTAPKTTHESLEVCRQIKDELPGSVLVHEQKRPNLGNALREAFALAAETHVVMMASDFETDPRLVPELIEAAKANPNAVITASRWIRKGSFHNYSSVRVLLNFLFQTTGSALFRTSLSDLTFGYRLFPTNLVQSIHWDGEHHDFLLETILKPIRLGVPVIELPTSWQPRDEGKSQNSLRRQIEYIRMLLRCRLIKRELILEHHARRGVRVGVAA